MPSIHPIIDKIENEQLKSDVPEFGPGDTVKVHNRVVEGGKERIQIFQGLVIARRGTGINQMFTVRKISEGQGVERAFPVHSPKVAAIEVLARGGVRRSKLNYLRSRIGKAASSVKPATSGWKTKVKTAAAAAAEASESGEATERAGTKRQERRKAKREAAAAKG
jgi:large subunit ribosomal protein L19